ncbi:MAG TPA: hypothetical protein VM901_02600 [Bdellovibrionota bacterium]|jgi:hypothetical protein|nr:hypothetical protein [Bdellovibrionota bacterium]
MNLQKLSQRAQAVVHGTVTSVELEDGVRVAQVKVDERVRGVSVPDTLRVELLQRASRAGGWVERVGGAVELRPGEEVLLFVKQSPQTGRWVPVGLQQGKYRVVHDRYGVRRALSWRDANINHVSDADLLTSARFEASRRAGLVSAANLGLSEKQVESLSSLNDLINQVRGYAP